MRSQQIRLMGAGPVILVLLLTIISLPASSADPINRVDDAGIAKLPASAPVVLLNFWATWCAPCREEIPALNRLHEKFPQVRMIGLNVDAPENAGAIPGFLKKNPINYETLQRRGSEFEKFASSLDPAWKGGIPATFVFRDGKRVFSKIGKIDEDELRRLLDSN